MKHFIQRRFFPVFLCMALALSLTACGGRSVYGAGFEPDRLRRAGQPACGRQNG